MLSFIKILGSHYAEYFCYFSWRVLTLIVMRPLANWIGLVDKPNYRKRHQGTIPLIGGVSLLLEIFAII